MRNLAFLRIFSSIWFPGASTEQITWYANLIRKSISAENSVQERNACC